MLSALFLLYYPFSSPHPLTPVEDVRTSICRYLKSSPFFLWVGCFQAKALAEKNKRDLLAHKEQAERNVILSIQMKWEIYCNYEEGFGSCITVWILIYNVEVSRNSGCWNQKVVKREAGKFTCTAIHITICMWQLSTYVHKFLSIWIILLLLYHYPFRTSTFIWV